MFTILLRKMRNTKWMVLCLFIGFLMAAGMMSTVPIYMDASLQRMLVKDMEEYQLSSGTFPGIYAVTKTLNTSDTAAQTDMITRLPDFVSEQAAQVAIPVANSKTILMDNLLYLSTGSIINDSKSVRTKVVAMSGLSDHVTITDGRMYNPGTTDDGCYEVILSEEAAKTLNVTIDGVYTVRHVESAENALKIKIVGYYKQADENDSYWSETMKSYVNAVMIDFDSFDDNINDNLLSLTDVSVRYNLAYQSMDMNNLGSVTAAINEDFSVYSDNGCSFEMNMYDTLVSYAQRAESLTRILWILQIPTMVMLAFYLYMVSQLNLEQEKNEIAVFKSRGASSKQVFALYAMEAGILGLVTLVVAPFIGLFLCQILGVSNGFLEFVNRTGIAAKVTVSAVIYALMAVVIFFTTTIIPVIPASKLTIVQYKQSKTKVVKMSLWEKCCVDIVLIGVSVAYLFLYHSNLEASLADGSFVATGEIDSMLFIFSTCLILGLGLLFVRVYPYLLKIIYLLGRRFWSPSQYMAITTVSRSQGGKERFLMIFLMMTFAFGIFSANTARAINNNKEDRIYYENGADIRVMEYWTESTKSDDSSTVTGYIEKDIARYEELDGVATATKVLRNDKAKISANGNSGDGVTIMAIEPSKFAKTAWFRNDLLPVHWWNYCNALIDYNSGVLVSSALADEYKIQLGDNVKMKWSGNDYIDVTVLAIVDYWPGINPNANPQFAVMNYGYTSIVTELEPYQIWLDLDENTTSEGLYKQISDNNLPIESLDDASQKIISLKTQPQLQGMNGALTMSFIIIMIMTVIGFLIYWILSIKSRTLQFGILRAMGMSFKEIIGILGYEQILVSGVSIAIAFIIGGIASDLFVPLFQNMYAITDQIPPFRVAAMQSDYIKIYAIIVVMLGGGFAILGKIIKKINVNKALKLGED